MRYNVAQLLKERPGGSRCHTISGVLHDVDENNPGATLVGGDATLIRTLKGILASGSAHLSMAQACSRCLAPTESAVSFDFSEEFIPSVDIDTGASLPTVDADSPELVIDEHHTLDLTELLRQYAVLAGACSRPCRPDCRGLCPVCGADLNAGPCGCDVSRTDPRLAVLAELLHSPDEE
jgi:uncharacterized metal-binding protein YceD (DUF177 family)